MKNEFVHTGFFAVTGTGKSHEVKRRLACLPSHSSRVVVVSPADEFTTTSPDRKGPLNNAATLAELKGCPEVLFTPRVALAIVGLDPLKPQQSATAVKLIARLQSKWKEAHNGKLPPRLLLVLDEAGGAAAHCRRELEALATLGDQHLNVVVWVAAQRPQLIPITVRSQLKRIVLGHLAEPADVEAATERAHDPSLAERLHALPAHYSQVTPGEPYPFIEIQPGTRAAVKKSAAAASTAIAPPRPEVPVNPSPPANPKQKEAVT